ncbi:TetR/AcrR family transcriptional regulator [Streptosporangium canum]
MASSRRIGGVTVAVRLYDSRVPRVADPDQRRAQIARAFQRLLAAEGVAGVSFSRVAAEAGVSVGLIQHYFAGKDELLHFAYDDAVRRMSERVRKRVREGSAAGLQVAQVLPTALSSCCRWTTSGRSSIASGRPFRLRRCITPVSLMSPGGRVVTCLDTSRWRSRTAKSSETGDGGRPRRSSRGPGSATRPCPETRHRSWPSRSRTSTPWTRTV